MPWRVKREPPSSKMCEPVMCADAGDERNSARPAMSDGTPMRPEKNRHLERGWEWEHGKDPPVG